MKQYIAIGDGGPTTLTLWNKATEKLLGEFVSAVIYAQDVAQSY